MGWDEGWTLELVGEGLELVPGYTYPLLVVEDGLHPLEVHGLEGHQHQQRVGVVLRPGVEVGRLGVEEAHGGLGAHVLLITMDWSVVQPCWGDMETSQGSTSSIGGTREGDKGTEAGLYLITTS